MVMDGSEVGSAELDGFVDMVSVIELDCVELGDGLEVETLGNAVVILVAGAALPVAVDET